MCVLEEHIEPKHITYYFMKQPTLKCTFVGGAAEVGAAVPLVLTGGASLSSCSVLAALAPHTQMFPTALLILTTRLTEE